MTEAHGDKAASPLIPAVSYDIFDRTVACYQAEHPAHRLTPEQIDQARALAVSEQMVTTVSVDAGMGRSVVLELLAQAVKASGGRVIGLGLSRITASFLAETLGGCPAYALTHWLDERRTAGAPGAEPADFDLKPGDVLFLQDAHLADPQHRSTLILDAARSGALVRLIGKGAS